MLVLFDARQRLCAASLGIAARTGLDPAHFTPGATLDGVRAALAAARPDVVAVPLDDGGVCLTLQATADPAPPDQALGAKSRFLATMSHELRTPLNVVIGFAEALTRETNIPAERVTEFAVAIHQAGQDLLGQINNMIDVARIEQGRFELHADTIDIAHLVNTCVTVARDAARRARVQLSGVTETGELRLRGDERRLRQVLGHLLANAVAFTGAGGRVTLTAALTAAGELSLQVDDTGIGIAADQITRVFEPFSQADGSLSRRTQGVGLGLYVARALIQAHGGTLTLESTPGIRTTARITLPRARLIEPSASAALLQESQ
jgi:signal transduction histidine kinase